MYDMVGGWEFVWIILQSHLSDVALWCTQSAFLMESAWEIKKNNNTVYIVRNQKKPMYLNITWSSIYIYFFYLTLLLEFVSMIMYLNITWGSIYIYFFLSYLVIGIRVYGHVFKYNVRFNIYIFFYLTLLLEFVSMTMYLNITWGSIYIYFYLTLLLRNSCLWTCI